MRRTRRELRDTLGVAILTSGTVPLHTDISSYCTRNHLLLHSSPRPMLEERSLLIEGASRLMSLWRSMAWSLLLQAGSLVLATPTKVNESAET